MWEAEIVKYVESCAENDDDLPIMASRLVSAQIVVGMEFEWGKGKLSYHVAPNEALPPEMNSDMTELFLHCAMGRPADYRMPIDAPMYVDWFVGDWCWRFLITYEDTAGGGHLVSRLLQELPRVGRLSAHLHLLSGDEAQPFGIHADADADDEMLSVQVRLGEQELQARCLRSELLATIQSAHTELSGGEAPEENN